MQQLPTIWRKMVVPVVLGMVLFASPGFAQLSGSYTIGSGGNYASFSAAVTALTTGGVSGAVTFNVLSGTYSEQISIPAITGASSTNTITFDGGSGNASTRILTYSATSTYSPTVALNGADYIRFKNLTIRSTNTSYGQAILFTNSADYNEISDCVIEVTSSSTSASIIPILASSTTSYSSYGDHGNFNVIKDNAISGGYYGIRWNGSSSSDYTTAQGNQFIGNTLTEWYYYGMYLYYPGGALVVRGNTAVQRTSGSITTSGGYAYYVYYPNNGPEISYNYGWARISPFYVYRPNNYYASSTNRGKVFNNMGVADGTGTVYGLYVSYARYTDVVYNSIQTRNTTGTGYGIYSYGESSSYDAKFLNNMISHDGSGTYYWIYNYYSGSMSAFDYNVFYLTGSVTTQYCYWNGSNYSTFANCKALVSGFHQNSMVADPRWQSTTDNHSTSLAAYQAGTPFSGITDDYDGDTRSSTVPSIGADEYLLTNMAYSSATSTQGNTNPASSGIANQEVIGIEIVVTGSLSALNATSFALNTTGTTNTADITAAKIYYTGNSPVFATTTLVGTTANPSGSFTITGSQALDGPGTNYFWLTYDLSMSASAGNYIDAQCTGVTVGGTSYATTVSNPSGNRMILSPLSGVYTIDPNGSGSTNFTSFTNAVNRLIQIGVNGPVTFNVAAATYNEQIVIPPILGASATNTITFDGGTGNAATRIIAYSTTNTYDPTWLFDGADYITLKNLTVRATNPTYGFAVQLSPGADGLGSNYNTLMNCNLECPVNTTSSYHSPLVASTIGSISGYANNANYTLVQDCNIVSGYYGIRWNGVTSSNYTNNVGNEFIGNNIYDWYYYGTYFYYTGSGLKIKQNNVVQRNTGTYTTSSGYGIYGYYNNDGPEISYNYARAAYAPFYLPYLNYVYASTSNRGKVFNNMLVGIGTSTIYAFYVNYPKYTDVVFNSAYASTSGTCYGGYWYGESSSYDNKYANNWVVLQGGGTFYPIYNYYSSSISYCNYNAFYRIGTTGTNYFYWNGTNYTSLAALQTAVSTQHQNSKWGNPYFHSQTDLHSNSHIGYQAGTPWAGITDDHDGDTRNTLTPSIGADEYPAPPPELDLAVAKVRLNYADNKFARIEGTATHAVDVVVQNTGLSTNPATFDVVYKVGSMPTSAVDGVAQTFSPTWVGNRAKVTFATPVTAQLPSPGITVYARVFWAQDQDGANDGGSDTRKFDIVKVHGQENFNLM
ncbi:MAG TPA: BNR-repeat neuraminidase N-terminal domain-containing protein, partial [Bacteroidota bacterium]|nr:BNR-repeat neuraminidase N-terminal domain-containing protein [Bacteroidota bacterium]